MKDAETNRWAFVRSVSGSALLLLMGSGSVSFGEGHSWKEGFAGCTGTSPYIEALISKTDSDVRPLMKIGEMQAWAIKDEDGRPATALTTPDGLTIVGRIIGPQGEDITAALLATVPGQSAALVPPANAITSTPTSEDVPIVRTSPALDQVQLGAASQAIPSLSAATPKSRLASAPITAIEQPSADVQAGINAIFKEAGEERIWFSAGTPNPGAPVVYMLADPECPHCQWTIDQMQNEIASGAIDLRIIHAPITGVQGFNTALSILHSEDIPQTFMAHMTSKTRGTPEMIRDYRRRVDESQKAAATPPSGQFPKPITDAKRLTLDSAQEPEVLLTGPDTVSVMAFYDRTGAAWPIASYVIGKPKSFQVYAMQEGSNQLAVTPLVPHGFSNIVVSLVGESRPLVFDVRTNALNTHYRRDFTVHGLGPNAASKPLQSRQSEPVARASNDVMMSFATGADIPGNAVRLSTDNPGVRAWSYDGAIYLQSADAIISPPASRILTGPGQVKAYRIRPTSVALISSNGRVSKVRISQ